MRRGLAQPRSARRVASSILRTAHRLLLALSVIAATWLGGLIWFAESIPRDRDAPALAQATDAIVVLTGGPARLKAGLAELEAGRARKLFVSGVNPRVELAELLRTAGQPASAAECCIVLGYAADNTLGNAAETRQWMEREGYRSLRLVTASYHMRRSLAEFRRAMPAVEIVAHPVFPDAFMRDSWWSFPGTLALVVSEYHKYMAVLVRERLTAPDGGR
ncbi:MAG: YdcF family protein [Alphaproteobacteria bacterium]|nr:YdcF family protein [Alphaproteobacteria bacterium]